MINELHLSDSKGNILISLMEDEVIYTDDILFREQDGVVFAMLKGFTTEIDDPIKFITTGE